MNYIISFLVIFILMCFEINAQIISPAESFLLNFLNQPTNNKFVLKGEFSFTDTISLAKLPVSAVQKSFTNYAIKIPPEQILKPISQTEFIPELKTNFRMQFTIFYKTNYFLIELNPEENIVYSISCGLKTGDFNDQLSISFKSNSPSVYNLQKVKSLRTGNVTNYEITEGKRIDFNENPLFTKTSYPEEFQLCERMYNFGLGIIYYLKNKGCLYKDHLAGRKIFTIKHISFINHALDSLIKMYAIQEQVNENITNLQQVQNAELVIKITYTNHFRDGHIYEASDPQIVNIQKTHGNMNYYRITTTIREITDKIINNIPTPVKYCLPIKYSKTIFVYYKKGRVVRIDE